MAANIRTNRPDYQIKTKQEYAELCYVPESLARKKNGPDYRFITIREPLEQTELFDTEEKQLPFPTLELKDSIHYKILCIVTNQTDPGEQVIHWHRQRCGDSEKAHAIMKEDLAGGRFPSGDFGENAAWWTIMLLAFNLSALMSQWVSLSLYPPYLFTFLSRIKSFLFPIKHG